MDNKNQKICFECDEIIKYNRYDNIKIDNKSGYYICYSCSRDIENLSSEYDEMLEITRLYNNK